MEQNVGLLINTWHNTARQFNGDKQFIGSQRERSPVEGQSLSDEMKAITFDDAWTNFISQCKAGHFNGLGRGGCSQS